jgi:hypothetical protein
MFPEPVGNPVKPDGMQPRIAENNLHNASGSGVSVEDGFDVLLYL